MVRHLTAPELVRLADPARADDPGGAEARAHLAGCAVCGARVDALREQEAALAAALVDLDETPEAPAESARLDALADRMMDRLRLDVGGASASPAPVSPTLAVVAGDAPRAARGRPRAAALFWGGAGLAAVAAGLAFLLLRAPSPREGRPTPPIATATPDTSRAPVVAVAPTPIAPRPSPDSARARPAPAIAQATPPAADTVGEEEVTRGGELLRPLQDRLARLLARYSAALDARDTAAVRALFPTAPDDALRAPAGARRLALQPRTLRRIGADSAEATVRVTDEGTLAPARDVVFVFRRGPEGWIIARAGPP